MQNSNLQVASTAEVERFARETRDWLATQEGQTTLTKTLIETMKKINQIYEIAKLNPEDFRNPITL